MATATAKHDHPSADVRPDSTIELDDNVVQKLAESDSKFVKLSSEAKASFDSHNPSLRGALIAREYYCSASRAALNREIRSRWVLANTLQAATDAERAMTLRQAIRMYPRAVMWSIFFSTAVVMEGYDLVLIGAFFAYPTFQHKYGTLTAKGKWQIPAPWQAGLGNGARVGEILGLLLNGIVCDRIGFRWTMIGSLILLTGLIFIPVFAQNIETLQVAVILMGVPWGVFQTLTTAYAAERLSHDICQHVLGLWPTHRQWCASRPALPRRSMELSHSVCPAMDLAHPTHRRYRVGT
jgi:hypothetical protein